MRVKYIIVMMFISGFVIAQDTKKVRRVMQGNVRVENYEILKSSKLIHGRYEQMFHDKILEEGYYRNGLKDSIWKSYDSNGRLLAEGNYKDDKQVGVWNFYTKDGVTEFSYDFTLQKLISCSSSESDKKQKFKILIDNEYKEVVLDRPPLYLGGTGVLIKTLKFDVKIPIPAFESGRSGKVVIKVSIDEKGEVSNCELVQSFGYGLDEEVYRVVKTFKHWLPGVYQGKEVASTILIPYQFILN